MVAEVEIQRRKAENKYQWMLLQMFNEKEYAFKVEISDLKIQLEEGRKIEIGMRKKYNELEDD